MTITLPDGALAAGILAVASAIAWAVRLVANTHVNTLKAQAKAAEDTLPEVLDVKDAQRHTLELIKLYGPQLVRIRRAIQKIDMLAQVCEDCNGWFGEPTSTPDGIELCRCSDPVMDPSAAATSGQFPTPMLPAKTPALGIAAVVIRRRRSHTSNPGGGE